MAENPLKQLEKFGQSPWLDFIRRTLLSSPEMKRMLEEDGLKGMTWRLRRPWRRAWRQRRPWRQSRP